VHDPHQQDAHDHHELPFWKKYIISTDHKVIGIQYGITGLIFLFFGFCLMMLMRWQLAVSGKGAAVIGNIIERMLGPGSMTNGVMTPEFYNSLGAMHGTIMIFLGIVPIAFAAFGNFVVPLQIGAPDMTFPKINMASYQAFFVGGVVMLISFFVPGGAAKRRLDFLHAVVRYLRQGAELRFDFQRSDALADRVHPAHHLVVVGCG
jgi:cytochrome c oxidase subunit 1